MSSTKNLSRHYDGLEPMERLRLVITAKARGDDVEVQRLRESCPWKSYSMRDAAFQDRLEAQERVAHVVIIDMTQCLSKLEVVWAYAYCGPYLVETARECAIEAYIEGYEDGWRAQWQALRKKGKSDQPWWEDDKFNQRLEKFGTPPPLIDALNGKVTDELRQHFGQELLAIWQGFDRFCRETLDLDGETVMRAAFPPIINRMAQKAEMLEGIQADKEAVKGWASSCAELWRKFAGL